MNVLIACEVSGVVRNAFKRKGHLAFSCDLLPDKENAVHHLRMDAIEAAYTLPWDLMIAHPPCTYLSPSGLHWNRRIEGRYKKTLQALDFVNFLMKAPIEKIAIENPVGCISTRIRKPDQIIQPYNFGDDASKRTCLWLKNLPVLKETEYIPGRIIQGKERWSNQTDSGQNRLPPSKTRAQERGITYQGIAEAMANQWG